jgi:ppGpp synthetase/RelA/SpoT-type nucleotidyltranferase
VTTEGALPEADEPAFDFDGHRRTAVDAYQGIQTFYAECAQAVYSVLTTALASEGILVHSIEHRAKTLESLGRKASKPDPDDPSSPKYSDPLTQITDLSGVRVITFLLSAVDEVNEVIEREFDVVEVVNRTSLLQEEEKLGYQSVHFLVHFSDLRSALPEYARFAEVITEIQVRTILQHAWAEIEHDIQYKAVEAIPQTIRRRFTSLAGLLEIADREFQAISDEDQRVRNDARRLISEGRLDRVEVTPDALKAYLDMLYGPDGRMSDWSYDWSTRLLKRLGFRTLAELDEAIRPYDADRISRLLHGNRQGQLSRLEDVVMAAMGEALLIYHPWADHEWFVRSTERRLGVLRENDIQCGTYRPRPRSSSTS